MLKGARRRARQKNLEYNLSREDIIIPEYCPILNIPLFRNKDKSRKANSPTLDRVDNTKGYTKDNVRVISLKANSHKADLSVEEVERLLKYMKGEL